MTTRDTKEGPWASYFGPNLGYVYEQYDLYVRDPESVDPATRALFDEWGAPPEGLETSPVSQSFPASVQRDQMDLLKDVVAADKLMWNIRTHGHLAADTDPLSLRTPSDTRLLEPETYNLSPESLKAIPASLIWENAQDDVTTAWDAIQKVTKIYTNAVAYEFSHVYVEEERKWLNEQVETNKELFTLSSQERVELLKRLIQVEQFEQFLHRTFVGQKRFSIEGLDALVPMLDGIVNRFSDEGAEHILMGMAHRGRLNVLAHVLGKPYSKIFSEFHHAPNKDLIPSEGSIGINYGWTGDVKYHLGAYRSVQESGKTRIKLANNPSHLEYVDPVVEGFTRAAQEDRSKRGFPDLEFAKAVAILIHGDAAFPGEGVVAETLNFNKLTGYRNGGTIHFIANNRLGFTTDNKDARSTHYSSDLAKGYEIPIVHVNADNPEACIAAVRLASEYRIRFKKDFLIDLVGYRRFGHNESDDPDVTQPLMYDKVRNHLTASALYEKELVEAKVITQEQAATMRDDGWNVLQEAYDQIKREESSDNEQHVSEPVRISHQGDVETAVSLKLLQTINKELLDFPKDFNVYPKLKRILERRADALEDGGKVDWALAETLAFATILSDGKPIRLSGQDVQRGTFAHRHLILTDAKTGAPYSPLHRLPQANASFAIHNSPLSEVAVLGFEYGYNVFSPETFVLWEAQYGDFVNCAQVIIDQFIAAGRVKWGQKSSLVMLLPHGYEGQGPEHSSARLERFLQNSAEGNWTVANLTSAAQYFHLLRLQAGLAETVHAKPLIVMAPKSLIRNPRVASPGLELAEGTFKPVLEPAPAVPKQVERLVLCSGKVAIDLDEALSSEKDKDWVHVARVERLYPFPEEEVQAIVGNLPKLKEIVWLQEEPKNMGSWTYMEPKLRALAPEGTSVRYIGRPERSSTASGYQTVHAFEQSRLISQAVTPTEQYSKVKS